MAAGGHYQEEKPRPYFLFHSSRDRTFDGDTQMPDVAGTTSDYFTAGEPSLVHGSLPFGLGHSSCSDLEQATYTTYDLDATFNDITTAPDAHGPTLEILESAEPAETAEPAEPAVTQIEGLYRLQSNATALPQTNCFNINKGRAKEIMMLDALHSQRVFKNDKVANDSHVYDIPVPLPFIRNKPTDIPFTEDPISSASLVDASGEFKHNTDAQISATPERLQYATARDWEKYRPEISKLYCDDKNSLSEVQAIMKIQYGFNATYACFYSPFLAA